MAKKKFNIKKNWWIILVAFILILQFVPLGQEFAESYGTKAACELSRQSKIDSGKQVTECFQLTQSFSNCVAMSHSPRDYRYDSNVGDWGFFWEGNNDYTITPEYKCAIGENVYPFCVSEVLSGGVTYTNVCFCEVNEDCARINKGTCDTSIGICTQAISDSCFIQGETLTREICGDNIDNDCDGDNDELLTCVEGSSCVGSCEGKSCGDNGCGLSCGTCSSTEFCNVDYVCQISDGQIGDCTFNEECALGEICQDNFCIPEQSQCVPSTEVCDNIDNDCDGDIDEGGVCDNSNCVPTGNEICGDSIDNNCNGATDEGCSSLCIPKTETCNDIDDDCDNEVDEGLDCIDKNDDTKKGINPIVWVVIGFAGLFMMMMVAKK